jgi:hypothetical protein
MPINPAPAGAADAGFSDAASCGVSCEEEARNTGESLAREVYVFGFELDAQIVAAQEGGGNERASRSGERIKENLSRLRFFGSSAPSEKEELLPLQTGVQEVGWVDYIWGGTVGLRGVESMSCAEKERLAQDYEAAATKFAAAVREFNKGIGTSPRPEHERLQRISDEARVTSEQARFALEQHVAAHKC